MFIITGAAGFIGSVLITHLNSIGITNIICVDELGVDNKWKNLIGKKFEDIISPDQLFNYLQNSKNVEIIIHLGACTSTTETDMDFLLENNLRYSQNIFNWCQHNGVRLIYASSASTYGDGKKGFSEETLNLHPLNKYGFSKHLFDLWQLNRNIETQCIGLKFFNVYGPNEYHKDHMSSLIHKFFIQASEKKSIEIFGENGMQKRDFIYIKDVVEIIGFFIKNKHISGVYNVGTGVATDFNTVAELVFDNLNISRNIQFIDFPEKLDGIYQWFTQSDNRKLEETGIIMKFHSIQEGIEDYLKNYLIDLKYI